MNNRLSLEYSKSLYRKGIELIPGGSQTNSKRPDNFAPGAYPIYIQRGRGSRVWDVDGNEYIDYVMALGPISLGYCYQPIDDAVRKQLNSGVIFGQMHPLEVELAEKVVETVPCAEMVRFLKTGAEGTAAAARIARAHTDREIVLSSGYHGWLDTWMVGRPGVPKALEETTISFSFNNIEQLKALFAEHDGNVACVIIAPPYTQFPEEGYMEEVRELVTAEGALLVYDEIVTGFRLAPGGFQEYWNVIPDIAVFAKGIANGYPLACVAGKRECMHGAKDYTISSTFGGETLSLAAACATLDEYSKQDVFEHNWNMGEVFMDGFNAAAEEVGLQLECLGYAPISAMRFREGDSEMQRSLWTLFLQETAKRGVLLRRGGLNFISYSHTQEDIEKTIEVCAEAMTVLKDALDSDRDLDEYLIGEKGEERYIPVD